MSEYKLIDRMNVEELQCLIMVGEVEIRRRTARQPIIQRIVSKAKIRLNDMEIAETRVDG